MTVNVELGLHTGKKYGGDSLPTFCSVDRCLNTNLVGAHVQKVGGDDNWFIIMLCDAHNKHKGERSSISIY